MKKNILNRKNKGFSLVEILFVVIIIGVLTAVAVPSLFSQKGKADDSNAKQSLKVVEQLLTTIVSSDGTIDTSVTPLWKQLENSNKNISFGSTYDYQSSLTGNVRIMSVADPLGNGGMAVVAAIGGKSVVQSGKLNCWYIVFDPTGSQANTYGNYPITNANQCTATNAKGGGTAIAGDFPKG